MVIGLVDPVVVGFYFTAGRGEKKINTKQYGREPQPKQNQKPQTLKRRGSRGSRGFLGYCRELSDNLAGDEKGWANVTTPKNLCFLCYPCVSRFCC